MYVVIVVVVVDVLVLLLLNDCCYMIVVVVVGADSVALLVVPGVPLLPPHPHPHHPAWQPLRPTAQQPAQALRPQGR